MPSANTSPHIKLNHKQVFLIKLIPITRKYFSINRFNDSGSEKCKERLFSAG